MTPVIEIEGLSKRFGSFQAVHDVGFTVEQGEIFGLVGHNGAGKTTTLRMLLGLVRPTSGGGRVLGHDIVRDSLRVREQAGFLPASYALPPDMTPRTFLRYIGSMFGMPAAEVRARTDELLGLFGLQDHADRKLRGFSTGMTQKVGLAQALLNRPRVVLLDEPTAGLDPLGRHELLEHLRQLSSQGVTVLFSSHILSDIESLCRRAAFLHRGALLAEGTLTELEAASQVSSMDELYLTLVRRAA